MEPPFVVHQMLAFQLSSMVYGALSYGWLWSLISSVNEDNNTNKEFSDDESGDLQESSFSFHIEDDDLDAKQQALIPGEACWQMSFRTTRVPLPKKQSHTGCVIGRPPLTHSQNPAGAMAPSLLKRQQATLLNQFSKSDSTTSSEALPLHMSCGDQNVPQPKASADQNIYQHQEATFEIAMRFMEAIIIVKTHWPLLSNGMSSMVEEDWRLANKA